MALDNNEIPKYAITPKTAVGVLDAATAGALGADTNAVTVFTAGASGSRLIGLIASTNDTAAVNLFIQLKESTTIKPIAQVNVPLSSGNVASTLMVDCLLSSVAKGLPQDNNLKPFLDLKASESLIVSVVANMTAAKKCWVTAIYADY